MRKALIAALMAALAFTGCTTVTSVARTLPDGTKELTQTVRVTAGGKLDEGMLDFAAESIQADGSNWNVQSGAQSEGASTPDVIAEALKVVGIAVDSITKLKTTQAMLAQPAPESPNGPLVQP